MDLLITMTYRTLKWSKWVSKWVSEWCIHAPWIPIAFHLAILSLHVFSIPFLVLFGASVPTGLINLHISTSWMPSSSAAASGSRFNKMLTWPSSLQREVKEWVCKWVNKRGNYLAAILILLWSTIGYSFSFKSGNISGFLPLTQRLMHALPHGCDEEYKCNVYSFFSAIFKSLLSVNIDSYEWDSNQTSV